MTSGRWRRPKKVNIYLMRITNTNIYKIGYTSNHPMERIRVLRYQWKNIGTIELVDFVLCDFKYEKLFHDRFKHMNYIINGWKEYFILDEYSIELIKSFFISKKKLY